MYIVHCDFSLTDLRITNNGRIELFSEKKYWGGIWYFDVLKGASESSVNKDNNDDDNIIGFLCRLSGCGFQKIPQMMMIIGFRWRVSGCGR